MLLDDQITALIVHAAKVRENAYALYSHYKVGSVVLTEDDSVFFGVNVENASYGLAICAERSAICSAVSAGHKKIKAVIVITDAESPGTPCGACRQFISEFALPETQVIVSNLKGAIKKFTISELLPEAFRL